jgi:hypothetical protein
MTHPTTTELHDALSGLGDLAAISAHLDECIACRVWSARLAQSAQLEAPGSHAIEAIARASQTVAGLGSISDADTDGEPKEGELWRVGQSEAALVWVRKNFGDGVVDSVPVVLDTNFADEQSVLVPAGLSPLMVDLAAMTALRTHLDVGAFINRIGTLDVAGQIEEVIQAARQGRTSEMPVGSPIVSDDDDRLEYRQALRDVLAGLTPTAWRAIRGTVPASPAMSSDRGEEAMRAAVAERLWGSACSVLDRVRVPVGNQQLQSLFKVVYLDTSVVVGAVESIERAASAATSLAEACEALVASSPDADAVCVAEPSGDWPCMLFTRASLRPAVQLPFGNDVEPAPILWGLGLVDTLWKHLEGAAPAWEVAEGASRGLGSFDLADIAFRNAQFSIAATEGKGRRALQPAKKAAWSALPSDLAERVANFVGAVVDPSSVGRALDEFRSGGGR